MQNEANIIEKEIARLKNTADKHPITKPDKAKNPPARHWGDLPGEIRVCFTKELVEGQFYYHLSISAAEGRIVEDVLAIILMKMFNAPEKVGEVKDIYNECIRHFRWPEKVGQLN